MSKRPSKKEIINKVQGALKAVKSGNRYQLIGKHISMDYEFLQVDCEDEFWIKLESLLQELLAAGPVCSYAGQYPPQRSYEPQLKNMELWPYAWKSPAMGGRVVYLKFCLKDGCYFHVDCHESTKK